MSIGVEIDPRCARKSAEDRFMRELDADLRARRRTQFYFFKTADGTLYRTTSLPSTILEMPDGTLVPL